MLFANGVKREGLAITDPERIFLTSENSLAKESFFREYLQAALCSWDGEVSTSDQYSLRDEHGLSAHKGPQEHLPHTPICRHLQRPLSPQV